jgi:superoxide reductase
MNTRFYICNHCGNIVGKIVDSGVPLVCCGETMAEIIPGVVEASKEKHVPEVKVEGDVVRVNVGSIDHPMVAEHYIGWIYLCTKKGGQRKELKVGDAPHADFKLIDDEAIAVYAWCNLHGLWKADI